MPPRMHGRVRLEVRRDTWWHIVSARPTRLRHSYIANALNYNPRGRTCTRNARPDTPVQPQTRVVCRLFAYGPP